MWHEWEIRNSEELSGYLEASAGMGESSICQRCNTEICTVRSRKECFCNKCFTRFVFMKHRKQMMSDEYFQNVFKYIYADKRRSRVEAEVQNAESCVLLALSLGSSSLVALDIINDTITEQKRSNQGKAGFKVNVVVCHFEEEAKEIKSRVLRLRSERYSSNADYINWSFIEMGQFFKRDNLKMDCITQEKYSMESAFGFTDLLNQLSSKSSEEDIVGIIRVHLIKMFALQNGIKVIIWGHSMTRLAEETIALTVKGRGSEISKLLDNNEFDMNYNLAFKNLHPLRNVSIFEIDAYLYILGLGEYLYNYELSDALLVDKFSIKKQTSSTKMIKEMTINGLIRQYFERTEGDYSNLISTVVKTGEKLGSPKSELDTEQFCYVCDNKLYNNASEWLEHITITTNHPIESAGEEEMLELWKNFYTDEKPNTHSISKDRILNDGKASNICYGCFVILNSSKNKNINWPLRNKKIISKVLDEFVLTEDEDENPSSH